jgi:hypothetical protein
MSEKVTNYSAEQVARLIAVYDPSATEAERTDQIAQLADEVGKSAASVRAKLTYEGVYVPKAKIPAGKNTIRKAELVQAIADKLEVDVDVIGSLEKATKNVLARLYRAL